jgi:insertion element IS1 protein InsB
MPYRYGTEWQWHPRYSTGVKDQHHDCHQRAEKKASSLSSVNHRRRYYTDYWGAYTRHLEASEHQPGKRHTQKIERKHLTLRTQIKRLTRQTICFAKSIQMHDLVIGLFVNRYEFGVQI